MKHKVRLLRFTLEREGYWQAAYALLPMALGLLVALVVWLEDLI